MRTSGYRYRDEWLPNFFPGRRVTGDLVVRLSRVGSMLMLSTSEDRQLDEIFMDKALFLKLERSGHIITQANASEVLTKLKKWHAHTFGGPSLHIVVLTKRCNLDCTYCHMNPEPIAASREYDMNRDIMRSVIRFALCSPASTITFEFQGGEPFANFSGMQYFVEEAKRQNSSTGKQLRFTVVSNLMLVRKSHLEYCRDEDVTISYSLNGPEAIHDRARVTRSGSGSFRAVERQIDHYFHAYRDIISTSPLCVIGTESTDNIIETIEYYYDRGFKGVAIQKMKHLGGVQRNSLTFDIHTFLARYLKGLDYIYERNRQSGGFFAERTLRVLLSKIFGESDIGYMDWRNPCGDFGGAITYDFDGTILPSDEARSIRPAFELGNVLKTSYAELVNRRDAFTSMNLSLRDRDSACRECAFNPYCGVLPVLDYARTGDATPRPHESEECVQTIAVLDWLFKRLIEDPLPLVRMLPGMDECLRNLIEESKSLATS